jgi:hypothetical protein
MPNGGPDNCATCIYNLSYDTEIGWQKSDGESHCVLRNVASDSPFYTYCVNQNFHNSREIREPIGPVYQAAGPYHTRLVWKDPPDTPKIREALLYHLDEIEMDKLDAFPATMKFEQELVRHLMFLSERSAAPGLLKLLAAEVDLENDAKEQLVEMKLPLIGIAVEALASLTGDQFVDAVHSSYLNPFNRTVHIDGFSEELMSMLPKDFDGSGRDDTIDLTAVVRYHFVRGLRFCSSKTSKPRLAAFAKDPDKTVAAMADLVVNTQVEKEQSPYGLPRYTEFWLFNESIAS